MKFRPVSHEWLTLVGTVFSRRGAAVYCDRRALLRMFFERGKEVVPKDLTITPQKCVISFRVPLYLESNKRVLQEIFRVKTYLEDSMKKVNPQACCVYDPDSETLIIDMYENIIFEEV